MRPLITVLLADDEPMLRDALADALNDHPDVRVVGVASNAAEAVQLAVQMRPDVAIVDVRMPGGGVAAVRAIRLHSQRTRVIAHSAFDDIASRNAMLAAGAREYIVKGSGVARILDSVLLAATGDVA